MNYKEAEDELLVRKTKSRKFNLIFRRHDQSFITWWPCFSSELQSSSGPPLVFILFNTSQFSIVHLMRDWLSVYSWAFSVWRPEYFRTFWNLQICFKDKVTGKSKWLHIYSHAHIKQPGLILILNSNLIWYHMILILLFDSDFWSLLGWICMGSWFRF